MKRYLSCCMIALLLVFVWVSQNFAQEMEKETASPKSKNIDSKTKPEAPAPKEETSVTDHKIRIDGKSIRTKRLLRPFCSKTIKTCRQH